MTIIRNKPDDFFTLFQKSYKAGDIESVAELIIKHIQASYPSRLNGITVDDARATMYQHFSTLRHENIVFLPVDTVYDDIFPPLLQLQRKDKKDHQ